VSRQDHDADHRATKAERKERARLEREEIQRKQAARKRNRITSRSSGCSPVVIGVLVMPGGEGGDAAATLRPHPRHPCPGPLPGIAKSRAAG
jgi:hypothetical protein